MLLPVIKEEIKIVYDIILTILFHDWCITHDNI